ncbi:enoyl-CoA hydratase/isomerase family protein, partial [Pseudomonas aeruginosa]|uniref:enoyl-CoA hydratase/isomerase family protein n=1 Tax=Pseudomonas aeruginosa TaxID=287 RepID=UPI001FCA45D0
MTDLSPLQTRVEAGIAWLVLNRPQQRNALDIPTLEALHVRLDACERDPAVRAVVLGGSGRSFCAGADLAEWAAAEARQRICAPARRRCARRSSVPSRPRSP